MQPKAKLRKDYRAPDFTITDIYLDFQLDPDRTFVTSKLTVVRKNPEATTLRLDGHSFDFLSLKYNGEPFSAFQKDDESLTLNLADVPAERFELEIETALNPAQNTSLQGLYKSGDGFAPSVRLKVSARLPICSTALMYLQNIRQKSPLVRANTRICFLTATTLPKATCTMADTGWNGKIRSLNQAIYLPWLRGF